MATMEDPGLEDDDDLQDIDKLLEENDQLREEKEVLEMDLLISKEKIREQKELLSKETENVKNLMELRDKLKMSLDKEIKGRKRLEERLKGAEKLMKSKDDQNEVLTLQLTEANNQKDFEVKEKEHLREEKAELENDLLIAEGKLSQQRELAQLLREESDKVKNLLEEGEKLSMSLEKEVSERKSEHEQNEVLTVQLMEAERQRDVEVRERETLSKSFSKLNQDLVGLIEQVNQYGECSEASDSVGKDIFKKLEASVLSRLEDYHKKNLELSESLKEANLRVEAVTSQLLQRPPAPTVSPSHSPSECVEESPPVLHPAFPHGVDPSKKLTCVCTRQFKTERALSHHLAKDGNTEWKFQCDHCPGPRRFYLFKRLKEHHTTDHSNLPGLEFVNGCYLCGNLYKSKKEYIKHRYDVHLQESEKSRPNTSELKLKCDQCPALFRQNDSLRGHMKKAHKIDWKKHGCSRCGLIFDTRVELLEHRRTSHRVGGRYPCIDLTMVDDTGNAPAPPSSNSLLASQHRKFFDSSRDPSLATSTGPSSSGEGRRIPTFENMTSLHRSHQEPEPMPSTSRGLSFPISNGLSTSGERSRIPTFQDWMPLHRSNQEPEPVQSTSRGPGLSTFQERSLRSPTFGDLADPDLILDAHITREPIANQNIHEVSTDVESHKCKCGLKFQNKRRLASHVNYYSSKTMFICKTCRQTFLTTGLLKGHMWQRHKILLKMKNGCTTCGKTFTTAKELLTHRRTVHSVRAALVDIKFQPARKDEPPPGAEHRLLPHAPGQVEYKCKCGKTSKTKGNLQTHVRRRLKLEIFSCHLCSVKTANHHDLKEHVTKIHKVPYTKGNYGCHECGNAFHTRKELVKHRRSHRSQLGK